MNSIFTTVQKKIAKCTLLVLIASQVGFLASVTYAATFIDDVEV